MMDVYVDASDRRAAEEFEEMVIDVQCPQLKGDWKKLRPLEKKLLLESYNERLHQFWVMPHR